MKELYIEPFTPKREMYLTKQELYDFFNEQKSEKYLHSLKDNKHFKHLSIREEIGYHEYKYNPYYFIEYQEKYNQKIKEAEEIFFSINSDVKKSFLARRLSIKSDKIKSFTTWHNFLLCTDCIKYKTEYINLKPVPKTIIEFCKHGMSVI